jgi:hypothetical protein
MNNKQLATLAGFNEVLSPGNAELGKIAENPAEVSKLLRGQPAAPLGVRT